MKKIGLILAAVGCAATLSFAANSISVAKESSSTNIYVYDEKGNYSCSISKGSSDVLVGFTSTNVSVRHGNTIYIYDQNCKYIKSIN